MGRAERKLAAAGRRLEWQKRWNELANVWGPPNELALAVAARDAARLAAAAPALKSEIERARWEYARAATGQWNIPAPFHAVGR